MNNLRWTISWHSRYEDLYTLSIYDATGYQGNPVELTGGAPPFVTEEKSSDDFYAPVCTQSGKIEFVVTDADVLRQMMPTKATDRPVVLRKEVDGAEEVCWVGFISGELFSQPWDVMPYKVTVPVVSVMEAMRGVEFTQAEGVSSLRTVMETIATYVPQVGISVVYPSVMNLDVQVSNQNFREWKRPKKRSELGMSSSDKYSCQSLYEVVEAFCQYFGVSLREDGMKMVFVTHDWSVSGFTYYEDSLVGLVTQVTPSVDMLPAMVLFGNDGKVDYSRAYKRVVGNFETGADKGSELFKLENVWDNFNLYNIWNSRSTDTSVVQALFYGDTEVIPWRNGTRNDVGLLIGRDQSGSTFNSGGQIAYLPDVKGGLWYFSIQERVRQPAIEINMERPLYFMNHKQYVITIDLHALRWLPAEAAKGYTGRIYFTLTLVKDGHVIHYLRSYTGGGSDLINYEWADSNSKAFIQLKDGEIEKDQVDQSTAKVANGLQIPFPAPFPTPTVYETGPCNLVMTIECNVPADFDEEGVTVKSVFIDRLNISYNAQPESDIYSDQVSDTNEIGVVNDNNYQEEYSLRCPITTSASALSIFGNTFQLQTGTGIALDSQLDYISNRYDYLGVARRAAMYVNPREILELPVQKRVRSYDHIQILGQVYAVMGRNTDWRDGRTNVKIINIG